MSVRIRAAGPDDAAVVAALSIAGWRETYAGHIAADYLAALDRHPKHDVASWRARLAAEGSPGERPRGWTFIAAADAMPVGFVHCRAGSGLPDHPGEIWRLYILRAAQGRGIGRALMDVAARTLEAQGLTPFALWVLAFNAAAHGFYRHLGGREVGRQTFPLADTTALEVAYGWDGSAAIAAPGPRR